VAKVALRFGCSKQSKNLEWYLINSSVTEKKSEQHFRSIAWISGRMIVEISGQSLSSFVI
jgi:hypothetical protein